MRVVRLFGALLTVLTAGLLLATPAAAQPPPKLTDHITDSVGVLTNSDRAAISSAIDRLYRDRHIQLWVVYVDNFSKFQPDNWADRTRDASAMGDHDALLAVATNTKRYAFAPPPQSLTTDEQSTLRSRQIDPAVAAKDWTRAVIAAADGLDKSAAPSTRSWLPLAIGVIVAVVVLVVLVMLYRAHRRRRTARRGGHGGQMTVDVPQLGQALATAEARLRQISDYVARHSDSVGAEAKAQLDEAKRHLAAAHGKQASNEREAIAHANGASTLAAQAQTLANEDVLGPHRPRRRRGTASSR